MPIYEYVCMSCESHFEELVRYDDESPKCPDCGAKKVQRQLSVFAAHASAKPTVTGGGGPAPFGGCGHGSCGCH
jgi:putative FmdB family regulatory protein